MAAAAPDLASIGVNAQMCLCKLSADKLAKALTMLAEWQGGVQVAASTTHISL